MRFRFISLGEEKRGFSDKTKGYYYFKFLHCTCIDTGADIQNKKFSEMFIPFLNP